MLAVSAYAEGDDAGEAAEQRERVGERFRDCEECPELVVVPAGSYLMGLPPSEEGRADNEGPQLRVTIAEPFAVGVYEVTFEEWAACVEGGGCGGYRPDDEGRGRGGTTGDQRELGKTRSSSSRGCGKRPACRIDCSAKREWEYVARAGTDTARYWGESESGQCRYANAADLAAKSWISTDHHDKLAPCDDGHERTVTRRVVCERTTLGLYDVLGNVMEWTQRLLCRSADGAQRFGNEKSAVVVRCAVALGTIRRACCARPTASRSIPASVAGSSVFGWPGRLRQCKKRLPKRLPIPTNTDVPSLSPDIEIKRGKLIQNASSLTCSLVVTGSDFDRIMADFKSYFGEDVLFEEAYPNVRCKDMTVLPIDFPEMDLIRITS